MRRRCSDACETDLVDRNCRFLVAYDGTDFRGFAEVADVSTVMGTLRTALERILRTELDLTAAGRTDAGVHGWGQVVNGRLPSSADLARVQRSVNLMCRPSIAIRSIEWVDDDFNARFGKPPRSDHDAHRPVREDEDLELILSHQEERKISQELTIHFRRGVYLLEPGPDTVELRGQRCRVYEFLDGRIEFRHQGRPLPFHAFESLRRVGHGDIVANKRLSAVLLKIQTDQRARDQETLASPHVRRRRKQQIQTARDQADALPGP